VPHDLSRSVLALSLLVGAIGACGGAVDERPPPAATAEREAATRAAVGEAGDPCTIDSQCGSARCSADGVPGCGRCLIAGALGEPCGDGLMGCSSSAVCSGGRCVSTKKIAGDACALEPKGGDAGECDDELYCDGKPGDPTGVCRSRAALGDACSNEYGATPCPKRAACDGTVCAVHAPSARGGACGARGGFRACAADLFCDATSTCQPAALPPGAECGLVDGSFVEQACAAGTICGDLAFPNGGGGEAQKSTCVPLPAEGSPCVQWRCASGLACVSLPYETSADQRNRCERPRSAGAACEIVDSSSASYCEAGLVCKGGTCTDGCR
jgi:hypothetical protein